MLTIRDQEIAREVLTFMYAEWEKYALTITGEVFSKDALRTAWYHGFTCGGEYELARQDKYENEKDHDRR